MQTTATRAPGRRSGRIRLGAPARLAAAVAGTALTIAACQGGGSPDADGSSSAAPGSGGAGAQQRSGPAYAQCMRQNGVANFPDPQGPNQDQFQISGPVRNNPNFQKASQACAALRPQQSAGGGAGGQQQQLLAFAQCMRANGVPQFPDPGSDGGVRIGGGVDPSSPQFQHAAQLCSAKTGLQIGGS
jgi:hypothetical protein